MPVKIELPADLPPDLRDEFAAALRGLGPLQESGAQRFDLGTVLLILAAVSAAADVLATVDLLLAWREKARRRNVPLDKVSIVIGDRRISLTNTDSQTLVRLLEGSRSE